ncbi:MAG: plasmid partitioning protein [Pseudomonas sp.]|uniref:extracellular medium-chain-length polyhydroxyalkanoate depolymerase n=1 Tax=Pseudomonas sp. TaxID=306 RepID=UPI003392348F
MFCSLSKCRTLFLTLLLSFICTGTAWAESRCTERKPFLLLSGKISCTHQSTTIASGGLTSRKVIYQTPVGTPPPGGWPVVIIYQGSFFALDDFVYTSTEWLGKLYNEGRLIKSLLDNGYAVIAPSAAADLFWQTNIPGLAQLYEQTTDYTYITNLLQAVRDGRFGPLNSNRKYATGISSGGYNTSRMAISFRGEFKALAIQSGSYATCAGPLCVVPTLPADHPPTTFLHGFIDMIVPWWTMDMYYDRLLYQGIETTRYTDPLGNHEWLSAAPARILDWFNRHP